MCRPWRGDGVNARERLSVPEKLVRCPRQPLGSFRLLDSSRPRGSNCRHPRAQKDHGSLKSTNETAVTLLSPTIGTQLAAAATLAAASGPRACRLAYPQPEPSILAAEAELDSSGCRPGLACFKGLAWLGLGWTLRWQAERLGSWPSQRMGCCCGPGMIESGMGGMSYLSDVKEGTTHHTILWRMTS
jgi:hypothetical protein